MKQIGKMILLLLSVLMACALLTGCSMQDVSDKWNGITENVKGFFGDLIGNQGDQGEKGDQGAKGEKGDKGDPGASIGSVAFDDQGRLVFTLTDGTVLDPVEMPKSAQSAHSHNYGAWETTVQATCTTDGEQVRECSCGEVQKKTIKATGHTEVIDAAVSPTCTENGLTEGKHCSACGVVLKKQESVPAAHNYRTTVVKPTCEKEGYTTYYCTVCSDSYEGDRTKALGHSYENGVCTECGGIKRVDMRTRISAPIGDEFIKESYYIGGSSGCAFDLEAKNISGKDIKYITITLEFYNRVGDKKYTGNYKYTGPFASDEVFTLTKGFNADYTLYSMGLNKLSAISKLRISEIKLEYADGTVEVGDYGYESTKSK